MTTNDPSLEDDWVPVTDHYPPVNWNVLWWHREYQEIVNAMFNGAGLISWPGYCELNLRDYSHWRKPPKGPRIENH